MRVEFASNHLRRCYENSDEAIRTWGSAVARRYIARIDLLIEARSFQHLFTFRSLRLHPLKGNRSGRYAIDITAKVRLIVSYDEKEKTIRVEEVSQHYGD